MGLLAAALPLATAGAASARTAPEFTQQVIFAQHTDGYSCFRIPAIVRANDGTLLAFAEGRVNGCGDAGDIDLVLKRSTDGGRTWGPLQVVLPGNGDTRGNPAPVVDRRTGRIVLMTTWNPGDDDTIRHPFVQTSDDDGATWSAARDLTGELVRPEWNSWYATGPGHAIQLQHGPHKGRLIVPANHEGDGGALKGGPQGGHLDYSDDGGLTWKIGADDTRTTNDVSPGELSATELADGRIYVNARDNTGTDPGNRNTATSSDGGLTFDAPFRTLPKVDAPKVQGSVLRAGEEDLPVRPGPPGNPRGHGGPYLLRQRQELPEARQGHQLGPLRLLRPRRPGRRPTRPPLRGRAGRTVRGDPLGPVQHRLPRHSQRHSPRPAQATRARPDDAR